MRRALPGESLPSEQDALELTMVARCFGADGDGTSFDGLLVSLEAEVDGAVVELAGSVASGPGRQDQARFVAVQSPICPRSTSKASRSAP